MSVKQKTRKRIKKYLHTHLTNLQKPYYVQS